MAKDKLHLTVDELKKKQDPSFFKFKSTAELEPLVGTIGQKRAVDSINFGLNIKTKGFNIYVSGPAGTGKQSTINAHVNDSAKTMPKPSDWCYVFNFQDESQPLAIELPAGMANKFAEDMNELTEDIKNDIPRAFESEEYERRKNKLINGFEEEREQALAQIQNKAAKQGFAVEITNTGIMTVPLVKGKPMKREEYAKLSKEKQGAVQDKGEELQEQINESLRRIKKQEKQTKTDAKELDEEIAIFAMGHLLDEKQKKYKKFPKITKYLDDVKQDIVDNVNDFKKIKDKAGTVPGLEFLQAKQPSFDNYQVNVVVDNSKTQGAPVVFETNPSYYNLFGKIEYRPELGAATTNYNLIKPGAVHKANGGFLLIRAYDVLTNMFSWETLKRTLLREKIKIENIGEQYRTVPIATIKPEPIPADFKIILIGGPQIYMLLYTLDEDFKKLFKVKADFNNVMARSENHVTDYAKFIRSRAQCCGTKDFTPSGVAKIIEFGGFLAEDQQKLSSKFHDLADIISESSYWAEVDNQELVDADHVQKAIDEKTYRSNMLEEKSQEYIKRNFIYIDTEGEQVGQVNALSIIDLGDYYFGRPSKITARVSVGKKGVLNIEREVKMGGPIHNKGVLILSGYLHGKYGNNKPLTIDASLTFEQEYSGIEGDSASSTELYALISQISELPIKQSIAVTGSVNQQGQVQPIGGVNRKIEGFYKTCKYKGLTGDQGVMIPRSNVQTLMLSDEVINAVKDGQFHIWAVETIDEGIEVLTGKKAGELQADGTYPIGTAHYLVDKHLKEMAQDMRDFEKAA